MNQFRGARTGSVTALASLAALALGTSMVPAQAEPTLAETRATVDRLYQEAEKAQERVNDARVQIDALASELESLRGDSKRQDNALASSREHARDAILRQYQGDGMNAVSRVLVSQDPAAFLAELSTVQTFTDLQLAQLDGFTTDVQALSLRRSATQERKQEIDELTASLVKDQREVESALDDAEQVLDRLDAAAQERLAPTVSRDQGRAAAPADLPSVKVSGRAADAVAYALAQVGDSYVHGAAGPSAFDCSGLTMMAWAQAGVALPHSSSAQFAGGRKISQGDLQPGDLVFYYSPISHVGIYIGGGKIVHAANPRTGVAVADVFSMSYAGAVRPG